MAAALRAVDLGARHAVAAIDRRANRTGQRREEARPAGARVELRVVDEEVLPAAGAGERAGALLGVERTAAGALGRVLPEDLILLGRQDPAPLIVGLLNGKVVGHEDYLSTSLI